MPILPELSLKIDSQLGYTFKKDLSWIEQLKWGILNYDSELPNSIPIINKLDYE